MHSSPGPEIRPNVVTAPGVTLDNNLKIAVSTVLKVLFIRSPKIEDLNLSFKDYQKIFLQEDSFKKLYAVISKLQQENQNLLEKLIFMNHLENHESQLTAKEEELQRVNMTLQKFEKDNKVLQAMLKHTEVCEQKAPEVPNFQVIKKIELAYSRKMEEFERSIFGKDKKVAELLFEVAKLKEELHLARETHASVLKDRNCNRMGAAEAFQEFLSAVPMQGGAIGEPGERKLSSEKNGSVRGRTLIKETKMPEINEQSWRSKKSE